MPVTSVNPAPPVYPAYPLRRLLAAAVLASLSMPLLAANVPADAKLAAVQEVIRGNGAEPASLDPHKIEDVPASNVVRDLLEGLLIQDAEGQLQPGVAESWTTADNKVFTFKLRPAAKWSNGDPVTAADFVYSFQRAVDPKTASPYGWYLEMASLQHAAAIIKGEKPVSELGVSAPDAHTLVVTLDKPLPYFLNMAVHTIMFPVHKATVEQFGDKWTSPEHFVGNGAYQLANWVVNEKVELVRNPQYWDNAHTVIEKTTYLPLESQVTDMNRFLAGDTTMTYEVPNEHFTRLQKEQPDALKITPNLCTYFYGFNTQKPPFDDARVRKALAYTIDRDVITRLILGKGELAAYNFAHAQVAGLKFDRPAYADMTAAERTTAAQALLQAAGFSAEKPLAFTLLYNTSDNNKKLAVAIASMWKKALQADVTLENQEWKAILNTRREGNYQVIRASWCGDYNEASTFLSLLQSNNSSNYLFYKSSGYDGLMAKAMTALTDSERSDDYRQAEALLAEDMPLAPIYHYVTARLVKPELGGYPMHNPESKIYTKDLYLLAK